MRGWLFFVIFLSSSTHTIGIINVDASLNGAVSLNESAIQALSILQYDMGNVSLSPCDPYMFSLPYTGVCQNCSHCQPITQFESLPCLPSQDRLCRDCAVCTQRDLEYCNCNNKTDTCYTGNRVCIPLLSRDYKLEFWIQFPSPLTDSDAYTLYEGLHGRFEDFLGIYLHRGTTHTVFQIQSRSYTQDTLDLRRYKLRTDVFDVYIPQEVALLNNFGLTDIWDGLNYTFGITRSRRRVLLASPSLPTGAIVDGTQTSCIPLNSCPPFFHMVNQSDPCYSSCVYDPCPLGYTGDFGLCTICPTNTFKDSTGNDTCTACPSGYSSGMGSISPSECIAPPTTMGVQMESTPVVDVTNPSNRVTISLTASINVLNSNTVQTAASPITRNLNMTTTIANQVTSSIATNVSNILSSVVLQDVGPLPPWTMFGIGAGSVALISIIIGVSILIYNKNHPSLPGYQPVPTQDPTTKVIKQDIMISMNPNPYHAPHSLSMMMLHPRHESAQTAPPSPAFANTNDLLFFKHDRLSFA